MKKYIVTFTTNFLPCEFDFRIEAKSEQQAINLCYVRQRDCMVDKDHPLHPETRLDFKVVKVIEVTEFPKPLSKKMQIECSKVK